MEKVFNKETQKVIDHLMEQMELIKKKYIGIAEEFKNPTDVEIVILKQALFSEIKPILDRLQSVLETSVERWILAEEEYERYKAIEGLDMPND